MNQRNRSKKSYARMKYGSRDKNKQVTDAIENGKTTKNPTSLQNNGPCNLCFLDHQPSIKDFTMPQHGRTKARVVVGEHTLDSFARGLHADVSFFLFVCFFVCLFFSLFVFSFFYFSARNKRCLIVSMLYNIYG